MTYSVSVVQLCPAATKDEANAIAESLGYGPNNLSVELMDAQGNTWYGCHAWWHPEALSQLELVPEALDVITSVRPDAQAQQHWNDVLQALGLSVPHSGL